MVLISGESPGHSRMGISLHSRNVLVLLSYGISGDHVLRYIPSEGTQRIHMSFQYHERYHSGIL